MPVDRRVRILTALGGRGVEPEPLRICEVAAELTGVSGAGMMLLSEDVPRGTVCASDAVAARLEELQHELGEGPCIDAHRDGRPVLEPDLASPALLRWVGFTGPAVEAGARAMFGFPMRVGAIRLGALNLYRSERGELTDDQHADAVVLATIAARAVLVLQAEAPPGELAEALAGGDLQLVVHQATGMVSVQLGVSIAQALIRLRAHAFAEGRRVSDVARDVVDRELRFEPDVPS